MAELTGPGVVEMRILAAKLREADPKLKRQMRKRFRDAANPIVTKVQASILTAQFTSPGVGVPGRTWHPHGSLRGELARSVRSSVRFTRAGVALDIASYGSRMPPGKKNMNLHTNEPQGWAHPVFGRRSRPRRSWEWVRETGKPHWFEQPIADSSGTVKHAAEEAMNDVKTWLE